MTEQSTDRPENGSRSALEEALRFEELIVGLSSRFINLPPAEVDRHIDEGLAALGAALDVDRASLVDMNAEDGPARITHQWTAEAHRDRPEFVGLAIDDDTAPWIARQLSRGESVVLTDLDDLPPEARKEREIVERVGTRSGLFIPFEVGGRLVGYLSAVTFRPHAAWSPRLVRRLRLVGEIFGNALARQRAEQHARALRAALAHVNRVTTMGELVASISHQLKQPLAAIVTNAQAGRRLAASDGEYVQELRESLLDIVADGNRAAEIIDHLRGLFRRQTPEPVPVDVNALVRTVVQLCEREAERNQGVIRVELGDDLPPVTGDAVQLQQVLLNLLVNGGESMTGNPEQRRVLTVRTNCDDAGAIAVSVIDQGVGIPEDQRDRVFEPFYTTREEGMGMGLAICRTIVEKHGGRIRVEPNPGGGTIVAFTLPTSEAES